MRTCILLLLLIISAPVFLAGSCERQTCPPDTICTELFAMVTVRVTDPNGQPVVLDEVYTVRQSNKETIRTEQSMNDGAYIVLDDSYHKNMKKETDSFRFVGIRNGQRVLDEPFVITADCCHINKVSGKSEVKL